MSAAILNRVLVPALVLASVFVSGAPTVAAQGVPVRHRKVQARAPIFFVQNKGQWPGAELFRVDAGRLQASFTQTSFTLRLLDPKQSEQKIALEGGNPQVALEALDPLPGKVSYFLGTNASEWRPGLATFARLRYKDLYPGIDLVFYNNDGKLEYDFVVSAGADPEQIRLRIEGGESVLITAKGELQTGDKDSTAFHRPLLYQNTERGKRVISGRFAAMGPRTVGFEFADYDRRQTLVVDPAISLLYSTYVGGSINDSANAIAVDGAGNSYIVGITDAPNYPVSANAYSITGPGCCPSSSGVVTKFSPAGVLLYSTFLGNFATLTAVAVDSQGNAYITGSVNSSSYPTTPGAFQSTIQRTGPFFNPTALVTKLSPDGSQLLYSTLFAGSASAVFGTSIAVDATGDIYVGGYAPVAGLPTTSNAYQPANKGGDNGFIAKFDPTQTGSAQVVYATYLGGSITVANLFGGTAGVNGLAIDGLGQVYVAGETSSMDFPTTPGALIPSTQLETLAGGICESQHPQGSPISTGFVSILSADGSRLVYSTFFGGQTLPATTTGSACTQPIYALARDPQGNILIYGSTGTADFPVKNGFQSTLVGAGSTYVAKLTPDGKQLLYSTFLGSARAGQPNASGNFSYVAASSSLAVDASGNAYVTGTFNGPTYPVTQGVSQPTVSALGCSAR